MYTYTSMDRIFSKLSRDTNIDFNEDDVVEQAGEALEFIGAIKSFEEYVAFIEVKNHQCAIPKGIHSIIQIARKHNWTPETCTPKCITDSLCSEDDSTPNVHKPDASDSCLYPWDDAVWLDENGQPIVAYDLAYYRPFFDLKAEYFGWHNSSYYRRNFTPVRLKTSSFFNSLVCTTDDDDDEGFRHHHGEKDEYTIIQGTTLRFNFKEGFIALAYNKQLLDESTGYPLIPDHISFITAITKYVILKNREKDFDSNRDGAKGRLDEAKQEWDWYCGQASNADKMISGVDEHQNFLDQRSYMLPRNNSYYGFFGNLNTPERRKWNHSRPNWNIHKNIL